MKVYVKPPQHSLGLQRIETALTRYAPPHVEIVPTREEADLVVLYAIGRVEQLTLQAQCLLATGRKYAVIQVCLRSTQKPHTKHWRELWHHAEVVWSYYDLDRAMEDDEAACTIDNFYHAPLGADAEVFIPRHNYHGRLLLEKGDHYTIVTSGLSRLSESVRECFHAAMQINGITAHIGGPMRSCTHNYLNISDAQLACVYTSSRFVSGLRRKEGFELPAIEGLLCGARPIVFDTPDYRWNYQDFAEYIQETDRQGVIDQLIHLFKQPVRQVTPSERERAVARFNWQTIIKGFYDRL